MKIFLTFLLLFIVADVALVAYMVFRRLRRKLSPKVIEEIRVSWKRLIRHPDSRYAVMEADKLLDFALSHMGYHGNLGAKLKKAPALFSNLQSLWEAHKVRNNIAHQINYEVTDSVYRKTMLAFKQAFKDLKIF